MSPSFKKKQLISLKKINCLNFQCPDVPIVQKKTINFV